MHYKARRRLLFTASRRDGEKMARAAKWCDEYHGEPSIRNRFTDLELAALARRCGLEG